jgi:hypothetical protein
METTSDHALLITFAITSGLLPRTCLLSPVFESLVSFLGIRARTEDSSSPATDMREGGSYVDISISDQGIIRVTRRLLCPSKLSEQIARPCQSTTDQACAPAHRRTMH